MPILKMADSAVLREKPVISPRKVPASGGPLPRIYKKILSRDTKLAILRKLRKVIPPRRASGEEGKSAYLSITNPTSPEHALIRNRGMRFLTYGIFTLGDPEKSTVVKCLTCSF